ncbi:helix-turn-helix domain-containing protein [Gordonia desulfuricans]|uniref:Helix-turn-helix domain-containing protein n=1 Tax=Gordonia desulfuricans TaxID=89051 RepID=A0A7K3LRA3_9ACTN|nr:helix-turn-helix domain-containing protein [Gordonia desulfuricans]NDK90730.1 helix-turn-helix domain-containing protein [Gordonia desulfuricans]
MTENAPIVASACTDAGDLPNTVAVNTRGLSVSQSREVWSEAVDSAYCDMDVDWPRPLSAFAAAIVARPMGEVSVSVVRADPHTVHRTPAMIAADPTDDLLVCLITKGSASIVQGRRVAVLDSGAFGFVDAADPFVVTGNTPFEQVVLRMPRSQMSARLGRSLEYSAAQRISADSGMGRIASRLLVDLASHDDRLDSRAGATVASATLDVLAAAIDQTGAVSLTDRAHHEDLRRVQRTMLAHLDDPDVTLTDIARDVGISVRYLHKLFATAGTTPRNWLYTKRFERAQAMLSDTDLPVGEIAGSLGFRDVAHFSRAFRRHCGSSPTGYRAQHR